MSDLDSVETTNTHEPTSESGKPKVNLKNISPDRSVEERMRDWQEVMQKQPEKATTYAGQTKSKR